MLTPQEVSERSFTKATFGGYNMVQVDEFLDILTSDYSALYSENAVLKSKMKVLVDKVDEYRSTEEAMRKALMSAQRMADELVAEAQQKKESILREAEAEARRQVGQLSQEIETQEFRLKKAQEATADFVGQVRALQEKQDALLNGLQELYPEEAAPAPVDPVEETAHEIDDNVQRLLAQAINDATAENLRAKEEEEPSPDDMRDTAEFPAVTPEDLKPQAQPREEDQDDMSSATRINFGELQFGKDYEIR